MENKNALTLSLSLAGIGAAAMYLLDPDRGNRRRAFIRDKTVRIAKRSGSLFSKASRDLGNRATGAFAETKSRWGTDSVDDDVLTERIRSKMGRAISHSSEVDVTVRDGRVTLSGDVLQSEFSDLMSCVYSVRGVKDVENKVKTHSSTSGFPAFQGTGRERLAGARGWSRSPGIRLALGATGGALAIYGMKKHTPAGRVIGAVGVGLLSSELTNTGFSQLAPGKPE
jgi:hypothetical protein